jgi:hypothetical protein
MKQSVLLSLFGAVILVAGLSASAHAEKIEADLIGFREVPSVSTAASGEFHATINPGDQSIDYELRYSGLQGTVQQSHIHVAQLSVNGSVVIWLCQTATNLDPTGHAPQCPPGQATEAVVTGHITAANVIAGSTTSQQLKAGDLAAAIAAIRAGFAYANVHTNLSPGGEIRGQIEDKDRDDKRDDDHDKHHD